MDVLEQQLNQLALMTVFMLGIMVQAAIADFYKSMKDHPALWMLCNKLGVDYDTILEEECRRALNKYLK